MRVSDIIRLAQDYMGLAIVLVGILGVCFILGYFVIYKKVFKGEKQLSKGRVALMAIFLCNLIVVLGATLGRGGLMIDKRLIFVLFERIGRRGIIFHWLNGVISF
ncbi:hypothetical protein [Turicibacter sp. H121]|uniref:hypothetical protein n=1 Tax=Turicibacter sp. H121 TaxID=1712675 RepID=UPI00076311C9|nr:hypothetical protein [Turicibacter sp. H121]AMC09285.1 hypothetical protein AT726_10490 [Turicibacter sp. H121]MCU7199545.1 hypothetical protein [Turicibacter sp. H121]